MNAVQVRLLLLAAVTSQLVFLSTITGCDRVPPADSSPPDLPEEPRISFIGTYRADPRWPAIEGGAQRYAARLPKLKLNFVVPLDATLPSVSAAVQEVIASKPHAVCICVEDGPEAVQHVRELSSAGMFVIAVGPSLDSQDANAQVIVDWPDAAGLLGEGLPRIAEGRKSYLLLHENGRRRTATRCYERFKQMTMGHFSLTMLEERNAADFAGPPGEPVRRMLDDFHNAGLVVTLDPAPWLDGSPESLLSEANRFATLGASPPLWPSLRNGRAAALVGPIDGDVGYAAMELAMKALIERKRLGVVRLIPMEVVTPATLDDFARRYTAAAKP